MGPASNRQLPTKKSLRIWVRNNGHVQRKDKRVTYRYPRTVEACKDPFLDESGKNKMFFMIAINLFPDSKIIKPDDSDSDSDAEVQETFEDCAPETEIKSNTEVKSKIRQRPSKPLSNNRNKLVTSKTVVAEKRVYKKVLKKTSKKPKAQKRNSPPASTKKSNSKKPLKSETATDSAFSEASEDGNGDIDSSSETSSTVGVRPGKRTPSSVTPRKAPPNIPTIMDNLQKIIQTCSDTGRISFSLAKTPRQSRS